MSQPVRLPSCDAAFAPSSRPGPGVVVLHEWWGLNDYAKSRCKQLAELGYVAFACDMYGNGATTSDPKEAGKMAGESRKDMKAFRERAAAGLKILADNPMVDKSNLAAIGYCFGGTTCLQLACSGADLKAVVSFHGGLFKPTTEDTKAIKRLAGEADRVLLDVPCSGLGVLRRNPDAKWKLSLEEITRLQQVQSEILASHSRMVKVGGKLVC